jgi:hypothetical protein
MMPQDRRLSIRKPLDYIAYLSLPPNNGGVVMDVSEGGLGFHAIAPLEADGPIHFRFAIDSANRIRAVGELAWIDETRKVGGLRFTELPDEVREQIRAWAAKSDSRAKPSVPVIAAIEPAIEPEVAPVIKIDLAPAVAVPAVASVNQGGVTAPRKADSASAPENRNPLPHNLKPTIFSGPANIFSMFPLERASEAEVDAFAAPQSVVVKHPIAAVGLTIALALVVSLGIFSYISTTRAGDLLYEWGEKMWGGSYSQSIPGDTAAPVNAMPDSSR